jgi:hypothetical protein
MTENYALKYRTKVAFNAINRGVLTLENGL